MLTPKPYKCICVFIKEISTNLDSTYLNVWKKKLLIALENIFIGALTEDIHVNLREVLSKIK